VPFPTPHTSLTPGFVNASHLVLCLAMGIFRHPPSTSFRPLLPLLRSPPCPIHFHDLLLYVPRSSLPPFRPAISYCPTQRLPLPKPHYEVGDFEGALSVYRNSFSFFAEFEEDAFLLGGVSAFGGGVLFFFFSSMYLCKWGGPFPLSSRLLLGFCKTRDDADDFVFFFVWCGTYFISPCSTSLSILPGYSAPPLSLFSVWISCSLLVGPLGYLS